jgi:RNA polymerase sigma-70 factor, ECF subfamily
VKLARSPPKPRTGRIEAARWGRRTRLTSALSAGHTEWGGTTADGRLLRLEEQDRAAWDQKAIAEADELVVGALRGGDPGRFALQAAIAALHATAPTYDETDWEQILVLYDELLLRWPSPVVALNRAVAVAMVHGPAAALAEVDTLERDPRLAGYRYLHAVKADLLRRLGRGAAAAAAYERALALTANEAERGYLAGRLAEAARRNTSVRAG